MGVELIEMLKIARVIISGNGIQLVVNIWTTYICNEIYYMYICLLY